MDPIFLILCSSCRHHLFKNELRANPPENNLLMSIPVDAPPEYREKLLQMVFETFSPPAFSMVEDPVLSSYGAGRETGCVLDMGAISSRASIVYESHVLPSCVQTSTATGGLSPKKIFNHRLIPS